MESTGGHCHGKAYPSYRPHNESESKEHESETRTTASVPASTGQDKKQQQTSGLVLHLIFIEFQRLTVV